MRCEAELRNEGTVLSHYPFFGALGGGLATRWHWGANAVYEGELGGSRENDYELNAGLSYTVLDRKLSVGAELANAWANGKGSRGHFAAEHYLGPSVHHRPTPRTHFHFAPLLGLNAASARVKPFVVAGIEFWRASHTKPP